MSFIAEANSEYKTREYWEERFADEQSYDWLVTFADVRGKLVVQLRTTDRILVIGCGNSTFSTDLYDAGQYVTCHYIL
jgi:hypothetical protein